MFNFKNSYTILNSPRWQKVIYIRKIYRLILTRLYYRKIFKRYGKKSIIYSPIFINNPEFIEIGERVQIRDGMRMEAIIEWRGQNFTPQLIIGNDVNIEQHLNIICASIVEIKNNTVISFGVTITDIDHEYEAINVNILKQPIKVKPVAIGEYCFIGAGSKIFAGTILGKQCIVAANSVVRGEFEDYTLIAGTPARAIKKYNKNTNKWEKINYAK